MAIMTMNQQAIGALFQRLPSKSMGKSSQGPGIRDQRGFAKGFLMTEDPVVTVFLHNILKYQFFSCSLTTEPFQLIQLR
jgi:hypothetical protein